MFTVYTFGDSILDCGHYNDRGVTPAQLLARNDDRLFPEFRGQDLTKRFGSVRLEHRAVDGSMVDDLPQQARRLNVPELETHAALLTIGGNDLLAGLLADLHAHFLRGRPDWLTRTIEPSLIGASEIRRCFWKTLNAGYQWGRS